MTVYLDVLLLENFIVNKFLLSITANTVRVKSKEINSSLGAILGCIYIVLTLVKPNVYLNGTVVKCIFAFFMVFITFKKKKILFNIKATTIFILYSMLLAGICIFIEINNNGFIKSDMAIINFSYKKLFLSIMIIYMLMDRIVTYVRDRNNIGNFIYTIDIMLNGCEKKVQAFLDTGNGLVEPVTNLPVIVIEKNLFDEEEIKDYDIFYIPYSVINGGKNNLKAIKPNCIKIHKKDIVEEREALIAFCNNQLSSTGEYKALLSRGII